MNTPDSVEPPRLPADGNATSDRIARAATAAWVEAGPSSVTYGAVARLSGIGKSLVSHYFSDHEKLLRAAADGIAAMIDAHIEGFFTRAGGLARERSGPAEIVSYFIEELVCAPDRPGAMLLEIAGLALRAPTHRELFVGRLAVIERHLAALGKAEPAQCLPLVMVLLIGELLDHCPRQSAPLSMIGLRERVGWCRDAGATQPLLLRDFLERVRRHLARSPRAAMTVIGAQSSPAENKTASKRDRIVMAALEILVESDAMNVAHREIARRAQLPLAATTYHFASKIEILEAAYNHIVQSATEAARSITADTQGAGRDCFLELIAEMMDFYTGDGRRNTLANFHLALSACRMANLASFARRANETEIDLVMLQADHHGVAIERNAARLLTSMVGGIVLLDLLSVREIDWAGS